MPLLHMESLLFLSVTIKLNLAAAKPVLRFPYKKSLMENFINASFPQGSIIGCIK